MATLIAVDDDLDLLRLIRIALEKDGHRVLTFANPGGSRRRRLGAGPI